MLRPRPTYTGTAVAGSTVTVYVDGSSIGTTTATSGGAWALAQPTALAQGSHTVRATAQTSGSAVSAFSGTNTFTVDTVAPTVSIASAGNTNGGTTSTSPIGFTVTFSEAVTGFVAGDLTVGNGTLSAFSGSGTTYTFNVTPTTSGTATTVNVPANVAQDAAGNLNTAATPSPYSITYNQPVTATPSVTSPANGSLIATTTPTYTGTAVAGSTVTVYVDGSSIGTTTATSGGAWALAQPTALAQGSHTVRATAQTSGSAVSAFSGTNTFTVDTVAPTVSIASAGNTNGGTTSTSPIGFTVTFSEAVTGFVAGDLTVGNGTLSAFSGSGTTYTFNVTPTTSGTATTVNVPANVAQDAAGNLNTAATQFSITYVLPTVAVSPTTLPNGTVSTAYSQTLTASGGTAPYTFAITAGALPTGLTLASNGTLSGTPTASGSFSFTVRATDSTTPTAISGTRAYTLVIAAPTIAVAPATLPNGTVATAYSQAITASGGTAPYTYAITAGALPAGLTLTAGGTLSGTPTAGGSFTFTVTAVDASTGTGPYSGARSYTLTIAAPAIVVAPATLPAGTVGTAYSQAVTASGGTAPYSFAVTAGALPTGLTLTAGGTLSGTPTASGSFSFTITATDASTGAGPYTGARSYTLSIAAPAALAWNGSTSTDWFTAANWTPAVVPTSTLDVTISASAPRMPVLTTGTATSKALTIDAGATLSQSGGTLQTNGSWTNNGTFAATGGTVQLGGTSGTSIAGSSATRFWNLTTSGNSVSMNAPAGIAVRRLLLTNTNLQIQNSYPVLLESDTSGTAMAVNPGAAAGLQGTSVTVQRYIGPDLNPGAGYRHLASPTVSISTTTGTMFSDLATAGFAPVVNPAYNTSATPGSVVPFPNIYAYDQSRLASVTSNVSAFDKGWASPNALSDRMTSGFGYSVNLAASQAVAFKGQLGYGDLTRPLSRNGAATPNAADAGWNLMGNPYPSPYDYSLQAAGDRTNLDAAIYIFESSSQYAGNYRAYVNGIGGDPILAMGQAFFARVAAGQTSGSLTFRNANRPLTYLNPTYHRGAATQPLVQLDLQGANLADPLYVYFEQGATAGTDREFDAVKLPNPHGLNLAAVAGPDELAIDGLPLPTSATATTVPLQVRVPATGTYTLHAAQLLNLPAGLKAYLRDRQTGAVVDLGTQPGYTFQLNAAYTGVRFELVFTQQQVLAAAPASLSAQVLVFPNPAHASVTVELPTAATRQPVRAALVDALGRVVRSYTLVAGLTTHALDLNEVATGVYSLRLQTTTGLVTKKLVVD